MAGLPAGPADGVVARAGEFLAANPLLAGLAAAGALLAVLVAALLVRRLRRTTGERFERALAGREAVTVLTHPNPDPDALACAQGVAHIAEGAGTPATIQHPGQIRHQENRAFRTVLDLDVEAVETAEDLAAGAVVLVDHNEPRGFQGCEGVRPFAVVDHHPGDGGGRAFTDVRPEYGACASIMTEYCSELGIDPAPDPGGPTEGALPTPVATGLLYGILADTDHLTRGCSPAEFDASAYLYPGIDEDALGRIANPPVDAAVLETIARAITERDVRSPFAVSDVGAVTNVDAVPQAADELLRLEGITAVVVLGDRDGTLHLSGRSRDDRVHMGETLEAVVEDIPMSGGGGHARMGGAQVSIAHMEGLRPESGMTREELIERLFEAMGGDV